ncbi:Hypothetical predicted protein [Pelobates cultripes]|uniref:Uncharacterized protein n=1 Tax=Pelobates cultripes TaxID=61616 RepID=A0AAD1RCA8_PELCU|nr:Hypothetical predicted protein [Pelobates cultripes]
MGSSSKPAASGRGKAPTPTRYPHEADHVARGRRGMGPAYTRPLSTGCHCMKHYAVKWRNTEPTHNKANISGVGRPLARGYPGHMVVTGTTAGAPAWTLC